MSLLRPDEKLVKIYGLGLFVLIWGCGDFGKGLLKGKYSK